MPVIIMEKMCNDEPDMYIMIAFIGILPSQHRKEMGGLKLLCRGDGDFPCFLDFEVILFLTSGSLSLLCARFLRLEIV